MRSPVAISSGSGPSVLPTATIFPTANSHQKVVGYPPLSEMDDQQRREFHEALLEAASFEDLPGRWQAAILEAEQNRPELRLVTGA